MLPESQSELSPDALSARVDNMDYDLLTRVDDSPGGEYQSRCRAIRRAQYEERIRQSQALSGLMLNVLQGDSESATTRLHAMWDMMHSDVSCSREQGPFGDGAQAVSKAAGDSNSSHSEPILWSQGISSCGADQNHFELQMWDVLLRICGLAVLCTNSSKDGISEADSANVRASIHTLATSLTASLAALRSHLCLEEASATTSKYIRFAAETDSVVLRPSWLQEVSWLGNAIQ
jgi:hypothetical protein